MKRKIVNVGHIYHPILGIIIVNVGDGLHLTDNGGENDSIGTRPGCSQIDFVEQPKL